MTKIPVGATIAQAFGFAFGRFFNLLGIMWLPLAITMAASYALLPFMTAITQASATHQLPNLGGMGLIFVAIYVFMLLMIFVQVAGIAQSALGLRTGSNWYYFSLGKPVWRLIGAALLATLVFILSGAGVIAVVALFSALGGATGAGAVVRLVGALIAVVLYFAVIYAMVRLTFLLTPVVIAEERIGLGRSWALGRGNFWRIFVIALVIFLPVVVIEFTVVGLMFSSMAGLMHPGASPEQTQAAVAAWEGGLFGKMHDYWFIAYPGFFLFSILFYGTFVGAQCFAYRALVPLDTQAEAFA